MLNKFRYAPYSYSKISCYNQCPSKFDLKYVRKIKKNIYSEHLDKGNYLHDVLDKWPKPPTYQIETTDYFKIKEWRKLAKEIINNNVILEYLQKPNVVKEHRYSYVISGSKLLSGFIDYTHHVSDEELLVVDWKSGKYNNEIDELQMLTYVLFYFKKLKTINKINVEFVFLEHLDKLPVKFTYYRNQYGDILTKVYKNIELIEYDHYFLKKPSRLCEYCDYYENECKPSKISLLNRRNDES